METILNKALTIRQLLLNYVYGSLEINDVMPRLWAAYAFENTADIDLAIRLDLYETVGRTKHERNIEFAVLDINRIMARAKKSVTQEIE